MLHTRRDPVRMGFATVISALMIVLSVAVPVLERGALSDQTVVESEHRPGECPSGHDHTVCTQVGANLALGKDELQGRLGVGSLSDAAKLDGPMVAVDGFDPANPSRAPPSV